MTDCIRWLRARIGPRKVPIARAIALVRHVAGRVLLPRRADLTGCGRRWAGTRAPARVVAALVLCLATAAAAQPAALPGPDIPDGLGVNIHFTDPRPGEMEQLAAAGFAWVRIDILWSVIEQEPGRYDFAPYERLLAALAPHGIRPLLILCYGNDRYDGGLAPHTDEGRAAFVRWTIATVQHFRGRGILWEIWNEPNVQFWKPKPNAADFVRLALDVGRALRVEAPDELYVGPALAGIDLPFLETCFQAGLLEYWRGVTVHPYRMVQPESVATDYRKVRRLLRQHAPADRPVPILSGEWGYSSPLGGIDVEEQGRYLARQWLTNLADGIPLSIWYDWHDDNADPRDPEQHFGTVLFPYHEGRNPVYDPKPAWHAARTFTATLRGFRYNKRLAIGVPDDHVLLFTKGDEVRLVVWTTSKKAHALVLPASPGRFRDVSHLGVERAPVEATAAGLAVTAERGPHYLIPEAANEALRVAAAWEPAPLEVWRAAGEGSATVALRLRNPLARALRVSTIGDGEGRVLAPAEEMAVSVTVPPGDGGGLVPVRVECEVEGVGRLAQRTVLAPEGGR